MTRAYVDASSRLLHTNTAIFIQDRAREEKMSGLKVGRRKHHRVVFCDDMPGSNFGPKARRIKEVHYVPVATGRELPHKHKVFQEPWTAPIVAWNSAQDTQVLTHGAGLQVKHFKFMLKHARTLKGRYDYYVFDFDRTLSHWNELFFEQTEAKIRAWRSDGHWPQVRASMLGNDERVQAMLELFQVVGSTRVIILSNQGNSSGIRAVFDALGQDFPRFRATLQQIYIATWAERNNLTKPEFMQQLVAGN